VYRIAYPYRAGPAEGARVFCQATCEYTRLVDQAPFTGAPDAATHFITPSNWSKAGMAASGLKQTIHVVPHGVDTKIFQPPEAELRATVRGRMRIAPDRFVFLNVGSMGFNKGLDLLLVAFNEVRRKHSRALLLLKDQRGLYPWNGSAAIAEARQLHPGKLDDLGPDHVGVIGTSLTLAQLAALYGAADGYVSPYRAEGFNIPPLEAAACGLPIAVTAGGPTDDYAHDSFALKLPSRPGEINGAGCLEPELDALIEAMLMMIERRLPAAVDPARARSRIGAHNTWEHVVDRLLAAFTH
jgi:glycosyltransferase involved in cell wall biosynthesis